MSSKSVFTHDVIEGDTVAVNGRPIYVGGNTFNVQKDGPAALMTIGVSNDKANWITADTAQADALRQVTTRPRWARGQLEADTVAGREFHFGFNIFKETED